MKLRIVVMVAALLAAGPALAVGSSEPSVLDDNATYKEARALIKAGDYAAAIPKLDSLRTEYRSEADLYNWLGYAHRKSKNFVEAEKFYDQALTINPKHKGANEYLGELYVETGNLPKARERLEVLKAACGNTRCSEYRELNAAIQKAGKK